MNLSVESFLLKRAQLRPFKFFWACTKLPLKFHYDQILDAHFFAFWYTICRSYASCQILICCEHWNSYFWTFILACVHTWCPSTPEHRHKMVLCSDTRYPICCCPVQCSSTRSRPCTHGQFWRGHLKKGVFIVPIRNRSRAPSLNAAIFSKTPHQLKL